MPFYIDRFVADTPDLTAEEIGVYLLLLCRQWTKGSIPADVAQQARLGRVKPAKMRAIRAALGSRLVEHPNVPDAEHSPFMESVRSEMHERNQRASDSGRKGAAKRWQGYSKPNSDPIANASQTHSDAVANASQSDEFHDPCSNTQLASLAESARAAENATRAARSPAFELCDWFLRRGLAEEIIPAHESLDPISWCLKHLGDAEKLIAVYSADDISARAERFFMASKARRIRRAVTPGGLLSAWNWDEIRGESTAPHAGQKGNVSAESADYIARIERQEQQERARKGAA